MCVVADRMTVQDPAEMDRCAAVFAVTAYVIANLPQRLPRDGEYPSVPGPDADSTALMTSHAGVMLSCLALVWLAMKLRV